MEIEKITFTNYLKSDYSPLSFKEMEEIHEQILTNADTKDEIFKECWDEIINLSLNYTEIRAYWGLMSKSEKREKDNSRTTSHDSVIIEFLALERLFKKNNWKSSSWTKKLFLQDDITERNKDDLKEVRKRIGDFSNYLAFIHALANR